MTNNKHTLKWISAVAGKKKIMILALLVIQAVLGITGVLYALILRKMIDAAVSADLNGFTYWVIVFVGTVALQLVVRAVGRFAEEYTRSSLENRYKEKLFADLLNKEYSDVSRIHSGEWLNRLTSDTVVVSDGMTQIDSRSYRNDSASFWCACSYFGSCSNVWLVYYPGRLAPFIAFLYV